MLKRIERRRLFLEMNQAQHAAMKWLDRACLETAGATAAQITALFHLRQQDGCLLKELNELLMLDKSAITGMVNRLSKLGLVRRAPCASDARAVRVFITPKGRRCAEKALPILAEANQRLTGGFSDAEVTIVHQFLSAVPQRFSIDKSPPKGETNHV
jgi:MarR family transcriptional regulator, organic hydroperoxide resistance regulator